MITFAFFASLLAAAHFLRLNFKAERADRWTWHELAVTVGLAYGLFFATAFPLVALNHWSIALQTPLLALVAAIFFVRALKHGRLRQGKTEFPAHSVAVFAAALLLGILLERDPIHHQYLTHDPGAYLNLAQHVARTGKFEEKNELVELAKRDSRLSPLLGLSEEAPEGWQQTRSYGVIPKPHDMSLGGFHGFFGTPLQLAAGMQLFGANGALRIHWLHLAATLILLLACAYAIAPLMEKEISPWPLLAPVFYVTVPLVHPIFREPLSEPLTGVAFLSMLYFSWIAGPLGPFGFLLGLSVAVSMRISSLLYVPFAMLFFLSGFRDRKEDRRAVLVGGSFVLFALWLAFRISPAYLESILIFYSDIVLSKLPFYIPELALLVGALIGLGVIALLWRPIERAWFRYWKAAWITFCVALLAGVAWRYFRLVTKLDYNIGGYPFVLFNLDSLLFYGGPALVVSGFIYWFKRLGAEPDRKIYFLQLYLPFCVFFYWVYRFIPLNLQPNFQRYLIIELVPLAVLGTVLLLQTISPYFRAGILAATLAWSVLLGRVIQHDDISANSREYYARVTGYLEKLREKGHRPVVVAVAPRWIEMAYLTPLAHGFGFPVAYAHFPFSFRAGEGMKALTEHGYYPVLAIPDDVIGGKPPEADLNWKLARTEADCYRYPQFGLGAPPLELDERCTTLHFLEPSGTLAQTAETPWRFSWLQRDRTPPFEANHWLGIETFEQVRSKSKGLFVKLFFSPSNHAVTPYVTVNGERRRVMSRERLHAGKGERPAREIEMLVPLLEVGKIDFYFEGKATVLAAGIKDLPLYDPTSTTAKRH